MFNYGVRLLPRKYRAFVTEPGTVSPSEYPASAKSSRALSGS